MLTILIISDDSDSRTLLSSIVNQAGHKAIYSKSVTEILQNTKTLDLILLDRPFNLLPSDWDILKNMEETKLEQLSIAITNTPPTKWVERKIKETYTNFIFSYPCDLTVEIPTYLNALSGN
ncbi:MAG: hypothetical protein DHS20C20_34230 [Ardenticatenaceae bacterium]|nr:MAG: hypothetical protein DHS20C20_34230 [Ardenticatenaceae bacterium]